MPELVNRPTFYEGQILAPDDLNGSLDYVRVGLAQHERYLHTPGIATGLELIPEPKATPGGEAFFAVTCAAGMAIDLSGRQTIVPEAQPLNEGLFGLLNPDAGEDEWFPVFLVGLDEELAPTASLGGSCDITAPSRVSEAFEITFGRVGEEQLLADERPPPVGEGPGGAPGDQRSKVLLGFVRWNPSISKFSEVKSKPESIGPSYAGVAADVVQARGGELVLRARPSTESGKPAAVITEQEGGELRFGLQDANGQVKPVFRVTSAGDVIADGKVSGELPTGVHVESGVATDGAVLPLPKEIKPEQVERGQVVVHAHVTPRFDDLSGVNLPLVCTVDDRRVQCRFSNLAGGANVPGRCDYTLLAVVSAEEGSGP